MSHEFAAGQNATQIRTFRQAEFDRFAALSGDDNPIHTDPAFAARTRFGSTVAHGMFLYSNISRLLGTELPGPGTVQLSQELMFPAPTFAGEEVLIQVEVTSLDGSGRLAEIATTIQKQDGTLGCLGSTIVYLPGQAVQDVKETHSHATPASEASTLGRLTLGQRATRQRTFTKADLQEYVDLTEDCNPIYTETDKAWEAGFNDVLVPNGLLGGMFSDILGTELPGRGTNWLKQRFHFRRPVHPGQDVAATVTITRLRPEKHLVNLSTNCLNPAGELVCAGEALVLVRDLAAF